MKTRDDNAEKLVRQLRSLVESHLPAQVGKDYLKCLSDKKGFMGKKKDPAEALAIFSQKIQETHQRLPVKIFNPKDEKYIEKKLIHEQFPMILKTLKDNGTDAALSEAQELAKFLDDYNPNKKMPKK